jgi:CheY-like chemotaxis protein
MNMTSASVQPGALRILLAEDSRLNQKLATALLKAEGHAVTVVGNGREAVDALRRSVFDVVLMDVDMPEMDGLAATRAIRAHETDCKARIPIVAVTADGDRQACLDAGMDAYLPKPLRVDRLNKMLRAVLSGTAA